MYFFDKETRDEEGIISTSVKRSNFTEEVDETDLPSSLTFENV